MAYRGHYFSSSCLFLVALLVAGMWCSGEAQGEGQERELIGLNLNLNLGLGGLGLDICQKADFPVLCRSVVKGLKDPTVAMESAIRQLMFETKRAKSAAQRSKSSTMEVCFEVYDDAYSNLETSMSSLKGHDVASLNVDLSAALTDYVTCEDAANEVGFTSPLITRSNVMLREMATNCIYLSSLIHLR